MRSQVSSNQRKNTENALDDEIKYLRIDSVALMKIARHDQEGLGVGGWGQLLGIQHESNYIEVSDCFPLVTKDMDVSFEAK